MENKNDSHSLNHLKIRNMSCGYGSKLVVQQLDLPAIKTGCLTMLIGPNAAGKSTLLKAIAGLLPSKGDILYADTALHKLPVQKRSAYISFMPQRVPSDINLTVIEAIISALKASPIDALDTTNDRSYQLAISVLHRVGIPHLALSSLNSLSGGQLQMASLARTIVRQPAIVLLDEPTSALDLQHQIKVMKLARNLAREGKIVIMVIHDMNLALRWADQIIVLNKGKVASAGSPLNAISSDVLKSVYHITGRIESCSSGFPFLAIDDELPD